MKVRNRRIALLGLVTMIVGCDKRQGATVPPARLQTRWGTLHQGENLLAVHVRQTGGGQYIDIGMVELLEPAIK